MRQQLLTIVAAGSLMVSAGTAILWVRSYWRADAIEFRSVDAADGGLTRRARTAVSQRGRLFVWADQSEFSAAGPVSPGRPAFVVHPSQQPSGWTRRVYPASVTYPLPKPQLQTLGLGGRLPWEKELDGKIYNMPGVKVRTSGMFLAAPHWMVVLIGLAAPTWWWMLRRRRLLRLHRLTHGLCARCGYDLRASPQGGRCPECGTAPQPPHDAPAALDAEQALDAQQARGDGGRPVS